MIDLCFGALLVWVAIGKAVSKLIPNHGKSSGAGYVYLMSDGEGSVKIGVSNNPERRRKQLQTGQEDHLKILKTWQTKHPYALESRLHRKYAQYRKRADGEWFDLPKSEVRKLVRSEF